MKNLINIKSQNFKQPPKMKSKIKNVTELVVKTETS